MKQLIVALGKMDPAQAGAWLTAILGAFVTAFIQWGKRDARKREERMRSIPPSRDASAPPPRPLPPPAPMPSATPHDPHFSGSLVPILIARVEREQAKAAFLRCRTEELEEELDQLGRSKRTALRELENENERLRDAIHAERAARNETALRLNHYRAYSRELEEKLRAERTTAPPPLTFTSPPERIVEVDERRARDTPQVGRRRRKR